MTNVMNVEDDLSDFAIKNREFTKFTSLQRFSMMKLTRVSFTIAFLKLILGCHAARESQKEVSVFTHLDDWEITPNYCGREIIAEEPPILFCLAFGTRFIKSIMKMVKNQRFRGIPNYFT